MANIPVWLPEMISTDGEWNTVLDCLHGIFKTDFIEGRPSLNNAKVWWDKRTLDGDRYEEGFWHLISKNDDTTRERLFDPRRAERLPWCRPSIDHFDDNAVKFWDYKVSNSRIETYLWLEDFHYVVVFQKRKHRIGTVYFLLTGYYVDGVTSRRNLRRKYEKREI
ncbi:MAG: hypothetical protein HZC49_00255 [Nitrospirae bacterium]|nr:hypothetical protein [Nitrospirota bacterium]